MMDPLPGCVNETDFFERRAAVWKGDSANWKAPGLPEVIRSLEDGELAPVHPPEDAVDLSGLEALVNG